MTLYIYDTKQRQKLEIRPLDGRVVRIYTCGPTVYDHVHIGNLRTFMIEDFLRRVMQFFGHSVYQIMNITDVDDKTIQRSKEQNLSLKEFTEMYKKSFFEDLMILRVQPAELYPCATEHISFMIAMIQSLIVKGFAYVTGDGNVFFRIAKDINYGQLSHFPLPELQTGSRVMLDEYDKKHVHDFVLWKSYDEHKDDSVYWDSPWGRGRPGWHIECSAMALKYGGETLDMHVGGIDLIFPHHENEIAQSESCTGKIFSRHWMHIEHLFVDGRKMSKSSGNFLTLKDLLAKGYSWREIRFFLLSRHYRMPQNFTFDGLEGSRRALQRIDDFHDRLTSIRKCAEKVFYDISQKIKDFDVKVRQYLSDDLNVSHVLSTFFEFIREMNALCDAGKIGVEQAMQIERTLFSLNYIFVCLIDKEKWTIPEDVREKARHRQEARQRGEWKIADRLREEVLCLGYKIEDCRDGGYHIKHI